MAESQDPSLLQRRARRRLVGAIALVIFVVIVLPIVLDKEPSPVGQDLVIQIPSQDTTKFNTRVLPPLAPSAVAPAVAPATAPAVVPPATPPVAPPVEAAKPAAPDAAKAAPAKEPDGQPASEGEPDAARAKALLQGAEAWVVPLGAFTSAENVKHLQARLAAAGMKSYTETVKGAQGAQTRVRAGPFASKAAAEKARGKLAAMGLKPAAVATR